DSDKIRKNNISGSDKESKRRGVSKNSQESNSEIEKSKENENSYHSEENLAIDKKNQFVEIPEADNDNKHFSENNENQTLLNSGVKKIYLHIKKLEDSTSENKDIFMSDLINLHNYILTMIHQFIFLCTIFPNKNNENITNTNRFSTYFQLKEAELLFYQNG